MLRYRSLRHAFVLLAVCLGCLTNSAVGQISASLSGRISDQTGAAVPDATVTAINLESGASRTAVSAASGRYQLLELPVGRYEVHASKAGFADEIRKGIYLVVGQDATADLNLRLGQVKEQVSVT